MQYFQFKTFRKEVVLSTECEETAVLIVGLYTVLQAYLLQLLR